MFELTFHLVFERLDSSPQLFEETFHRTELVTGIFSQYERTGTVEGNIYTQHDFESPAWETSTIQDCPKPIAHVADGELVAYLSGYRLRRVVVTPETAKRLQLALTND